MPLDHLAKLNTEQRRAVEHGVSRGDVGLSAPLLVIAGAGSRLDGAVFESLLQ
jgi:DNA helicase II / ATP-dependent DNA helicase PcrA